MLILLLMRCRILKGRMLCRHKQMSTSGLSDNHSRRSARLLLRVSHRERTLTEFFANSIASFVTARSWQAYQRYQLVNSEFAYDFLQIVAIFPVFLASTQ